MLDLKGKSMADEETMRTFVEKAAAKFAEAEKKLEAARKAVMGLVGLMKEGSELGLAGYLQSSRMACDLRVAVGLVSRAESVVFAIHGEGTQLAQDKGVDLPAPRDGGGHR